MLLLILHIRWLLSPLLHRSTRFPPLLRCQLLLVPHLGPGCMGVACRRRLHVLGWWVVQHGGWRHLQWDLSTGRRPSIHRPALLCGTWYWPRPWLVAAGRQACVRGSACSRLGSCAAPSCWLVFGGVERCSVCVHGMARCLCGGCRRCPALLHRVVLLALVRLLCATRGPAGKVLLQRLVTSSIPVLRTACTAPAA